MTSRYRARALGASLMGNRAFEAQVAALGAVEAYFVVRTILNLVIGSAGLADAAVPSSCLRIGVAVLVREGGGYVSLEKDVIVRWSCSCPKTGYCAPS